MKQALHLPRDHIPQGGIALSLLVVDAVALADVFDGDDRLAHAGTVTGPGRQGGQLNSMDRFVIGLPVLHQHAPSYLHGSIFNSIQPFTSITNWSALAAALNSSGWAHFCEATITSLFSITSCGLDRINEARCGMRRPISFAFAPIKRARWSRGS